MRVVLPCSMTHWLGVQGKASSPFTRSTFQVPRGRAAAGGLLDAV